MARVSFDVVFIHFGSPLFLRYAYSQAVSLGYRVVVLGDAALQGEGFANLVHAQDYSSGLDDFRTIYRHIGANDYQYEYQCYARWFLLRNYMRQSPRPVLLLNSDVLIYPGVESLSGHLGGRRLLDTAWVNFVNDANCLDCFCEFLFEVFTDNSELETLSRKYAWQGAPHLSDMYLLFELAERHPSIVRQFSNSCHLLGFDNAMLLTQDYESINGHKAVQFVDGVPYCRRLSETQNIRFHLLHFQGTAKPLMECFHTIERADLLKGLRPLNSWIRQPHIWSAPGAHNIFATYETIRSRRAEEHLTLGRPGSHASPTEEGSASACPAEPSQSRRESAQQGNPEMSDNEASLIVGGGARSGAYTRVSFRRDPT